MLNLFYRGWQKSRDVCWGRIIETYKTPYCANIVYVSFVRPISLNFCVIVGTVVDKKDMPAEL